MNYQIENEDLQREGNIFWNRIYITENEKHTTLIVGATSNYVDDEVGDKDKQSEWIKSIGDEWLKKGDNIFNQPAHRIPFANDEAGLANVQNFLDSVTE